MPIKQTCFKTTT